MFRLRFAFVGLVLVTLLGVTGCHSSRHRAQSQRAIAEGIVPRDAMRGILMGHIKGHLGGILMLDEPDVVFVPQSREYGSELLFTLDELMAA